MGKRESKEELNPVKHVIYKGLLTRVAIAGIISTIMLAYDFYR